MTWQPIETYPKDHVLPDDCYWGPTALLRVPPSAQFLHHATFYVGHLEADGWLVRDASDPHCWDSLHENPSHWMPITDLDGTVLE